MCCFVIWTGITSRVDVVSHDASFGCNSYARCNGQPLDTLVAKSPIMLSRYWRKGVCVSLVFHLQGLLELFVNQTLLVMSCLPYYNLWNHPYQRECSVLKLPQPPPRKERVYHMSLFEKIPRRTRLTVRGGQSKL